MKNICEVLLNTSKKYSNKTAAIYKKDSRWINESWESYFNKISYFAAYLNEQQIETGDVVSIMSDSRFEWAVADMSILSIGAITVPIYSSATSDELKYILTQSNTKMIIIDNKVNFNKFNDIKRELGFDIKVICLNNFESENVILFDDCISKGKIFYQKNMGFIEEKIALISDNQVATIVYTSGTTGIPKGVVLGHSQIMSEVADIISLTNIKSNDRSLTFLPFAHILARVELWGHIYSGFCMGYAENIESLRSSFLKIKPTFIVGVPRIFEKIINSVISLSESSPLRKNLFKWSMNIASKISDLSLENKSIPLKLALEYKLARAIVFDKLKEKMGGKIKFAICGGAPLSQDISKFFHSAGLLILEGYGLTETTAAVTFNTHSNYKFGTVGKPIGDVKINLAEDGEILISSKKVMLGYYLNEVENKNAFENGWLKTGDIGSLTHDGYLIIKDRKKDLIKTSSGKFIAPQKIENLLKNSKYISNVLVHGDQRKYIICLITLNTTEVISFLKGKGISFANEHELSSHPEVDKIIREVVANTNQKLSSYESVKDFFILANDFSIEDGELTPSLKVRRKICDEKYKDIIDRIYGEDEGTI